MHFKICYGFLQVSPRFRELVVDRQRFHPRRLAQKLFNEWHATWLSFLLYDKARFTVLDNFKKSVTGHILNSGVRLVHKFKEFQYDRF